MSLTFLLPWKPPQPLTGICATKPQKSIVEEPCKILSLFKNPEYPFFNISRTVLQAVGSLTGH